MTAPRESTVHEKLNNKSGGSSKLRSLAGTSGFTAVNTASMLEAAARSAPECIPVDSSSGCCSCCDVRV